MASLLVRVVPRSSRDAIEGRDAEGVLRIRVTAPPANGAANAAVTRLLAKLLGLSRTALDLRSGGKARLKRFDVPLDPPELEKRLASLRRI